MKFFIFIGAAYTQDDMQKLKMSQFAFWNAMAKNVSEMWAQDPAYKRYGYGDDRPILIVFQPADVYWERYKAAPESEKTQRARWASESEESSIYGSYDDVCDAIHWGIADTKNCTVALKKYPDDQPYFYYNVLKDILTGGSKSKTK